MKNLWLWFKDTRKKRKIKYYKNLAEKQYFILLLITNNLSGGLTLTEQISPEIVKAKKKFNKTLKKLEELEEPVINFYL